MALSALLSDFFLKTLIPPLRYHLLCLSLMSHDINLCGERVILFQCFFEKKRGVGLNHAIRLRLIQSFVLILHFIAEQKAWHRSKLCGNSHRYLSIHSGAEARLRSSRVWSTRVSQSAKAGRFHRWRAVCRLWPMV